MTDYIYLNKDWRWHRDANNVILAQRGERKLKDKETKKFTGETVDEWVEHYFSSLENALHYLVEVDASSAGNLEEFTERLRDQRRWLKDQQGGRVMWDDASPKESAIMGLVDRMSAKHGPAPLDVEASQLWDWGQAVARELCGLEAMQQTLPEKIPDEVWQLIKDWDAGKFPEWMRVPKRIERVGRA